MKVIVLCPGNCRVVDSAHCHYVLLARLWPSRWGARARSTLLAALIKIVILFIKLMLHSHGIRQTVGDKPDVILLSKVQVLI